MGAIKCPNAAVSQDSLEKVLPKEVCSVHGVLMDIQLEHPLSLRETNKE
jgi:hypothetical protein